MQNQDKNALKGKPLAFSSFAPVQIRNLGVGDSKAIEAYWTSLLPAERRLRFHGHVSNETIRNYLMGMNFSEVRVLGVFHHAELKGTAELIPSADGDSAEMAIILSVDLQRTGVADQMMDILKRQAKAMGIDTVEAFMTADNHSMRRLAQRSGYFMGREDGGFTARASLGCAHPWQLGLTH